MTKEVLEGRRLLEELQKERKVLEQQLSQKRIAGQIRVNCSGPHKGQSCSFDEFEFFKEKPDWIWRCKKCWRVRVEEEARRFKPLDEIEKIEVARKKELLKHARYFVRGPNNEHVAIGIKDRPLERKYWVWWTEKYMTRDSLQEGYFWCDSKNKALKFGTVECKDCVNSCIVREVQESKKRIRDLQKRLGDVKVEKSRLNVDEIEDKKHEILQKYAQERPECMCGKCKVEINDVGTMYWAYDGRRWIRQVRDKLEIDHAEKRRCDDCYAEEKVK